ncbi:hypothetical protein AURDEDRAFT_177361 [Auricularia subglabra TFB-10046 SS5]|uniref:Uncharacterized protein n=1 Tax=Auricularia subglabra (strain TFB-10046 / SS5) TaxID=717982 RepID=J0CTD5_AURST|nr:hypothetical protein AURDEDRAFT_177361 [Auricularia subglabra TFB-10046 SS5]
MSTVTPPLLSAVETVQVQVICLAQRRDTIVEHLTQIRNIVASLSVLPLSDECRSAVVNVQNLLPREQRALSAVIADLPCCSLEDPPKAVQLESVLMDVVQSCETALAGANVAGAKTIAVLEDIITKLRAFENRAIMETQSASL